MAAKPHPIHCIVPPHLLAQIVAHGTDHQRDKALQTIHYTGQFQEQRVALLGKTLPNISEASTKQRVVYSAQNLSSLPGIIVRQESEPPTGDPAVDEAYDGAGATYDLYWMAYQRNSIDGNGMRLVSSVHYEKGYDNAFWDGTQMVYGDGDEDLPADQQIFNRFTKSVDVIGHELTHGITQYTSALNYVNQSGALNESFSDVFGTLVKQRSLNQMAQYADWIIGQGLFTANVQGTGIRSMKAPGTAYDDPVLGKDPQPALMKDYVNTTQDNGGVHINSGIPNYAFYLTAMEIGGYAWEKAGQIWFVALTQKMQADTNFQGAANLTYGVAGDLFGKNSLEQQAVKKGWAGAGINITDGTTTTTPNKGCLPGFLGLLRIVD
jgi:Zn-dependent metalloprotease